MNHERIDCFEFCMSTTLAMRGGFDFGEYEPPMNAIGQCALPSPSDNEDALDEVDIERIIFDVAEVF